MTATLPRDQSTVYAPAQLVLDLSDEWDLLDFDTLLSYHACGQSLRRTARKMGVHPSTVSRRIASAVVNLSRARGDIYLRHAPINV